jgi:hypothetical protein
LTQYGGSLSSAPVGKLGASSFRTTLRASLLASSLPRQANAHTWRLFKSRAQTVFEGTPAFRSPSRKRTQSSGVWHGEPIPPAAQTRRARWLGRCRLADGAVALVTHYQHEQCDRGGTRRCARGTPAAPLTRGPLATRAPLSSAFPALAERQPGYGSAVAVSASGRERFRG